MSSAPDHKYPVPVNLMKWRKAIRHPEGPKSSTVRHVLLTLSTWADSSGVQMYPSIETLSVATALHRETVRRALEHAVREGWVTRVRRPARDPRAHWSYAYGAAVPLGFSSKYGADVGDRWDTDPIWTSERRKRRRTRQGRSGGSVTTQNGDERGRTGDGESASVPVVSEFVPVVSDERPCPESRSSLSCVDFVPVQGSETSSMTSSLNTSVTASPKVHSRALRVNGGTLDDSMQSKPRNKRATA